MATSGTVLGNNVTVTSGHVARVRVEWQLAGQNVGGNYSSINWQGYVDFFGCDAQLDGGYVSSSVGDLYANGGRVYNFANNFSNHTIGMGSGNFNIGHDGGGNQNLYMSGSINVYQSGTSSGSGTWSLPTIPRYANFTAFNILNVTDAGFTIQMAADNNCSDIAYSLDNGANYRSAGSGYAANAYLTNLPSGVTYNVYARITRADSGLTSYSGLAQVTTALQNNFLGLL